MQAQGLICNEGSTHMGRVLKAAFLPPPRMVTVILLALPGRNVTSQCQAKPLHYSWPEVTLKPVRDRGSGQGKDG